MGSPPASWNVDGFRVRGDGAEDAGNWLAAINTDVTIDPDSYPIFMARWLLTSLGGSSSNLGWEASHNGGAFYTVTTSSSAIQFKNSSNVTGDYSLTEQLNGSGTFNGSTPTGSEDGSVVYPGLVSDEQTEVEAVLGIVVASTSPGDTIIVRPGPTNISTHNFTLTITVAGQATTERMTRVRGQFF